MSKKREEKISTGYTVKADTESGILKAYVSIFGIEDDSWMNDIIELGAFKKTIAERGPAGSRKIRVLWMHQKGEVIGKVLTLEEHSRDMLPEHIRERYPLASGGLYAETQLIMDVQRGREAFALYRDGALDEWSIGFDAIDKKFEEVDKRVIRRLKEIKLWEYSPVTWGANPATATVEVKSNIIELLDEVKAEHPEYDDLTLIKSVEQRLLPIEKVKNSEKEASEAESNPPAEEQKTILALLDEVKAEHPEYNDYELIQAVEKRLAPQQDVIEPEQQIEPEAKQAVEPEPVVAEPEQAQAELPPAEEPPPLVNAVQGKWVASRRIQLRELELALSRGRHYANQS